MRLTQNRPLELLCLFLSEKSKDLSPIDETFIPHLLQILKRGINEALSVFTISSDKSIFLDWKDV